MTLIHVIHIFVISHLTPMQALYHQWRRAISRTQALSPSSRAPRPRDRSQGMQAKASSHLLDAVQAMR